MKISFEMREASLFYFHHYLLLQLRDLFNYIIEFSHFCFYEKKSKKVGKNEVREDALMGVEGGRVNHKKWRGKGYKGGN